MKKVLLVEDYETTRRATTMLLRSSGYDVIEAASGTEALRLVHEERPQLVLLDVNLPDLSGIEVCRQIKANPATAATLVLEISGHYTGSGDKARGLDSGADGYLIKPVETSELLATIRALFRLHEAEDAARRMRLRAEASAARFRGLIDGLKAIVWEANAQTWQFTFVSRRAEEMLGFPLSRWLNEPDFWSSLIHPADREATIRACREATEAGHDNDLEYRVIAADGREVWLRDLVFVEPQEDDRPARLSGVMIDITARKQDALARRTSEERFRAIFDQVIAGIAQTDLDGRFTLVNRRFAEIVGRAEAELLGMKMQEITHPEDLAPNLVLFERMIQEGTGFVIEKRYLRPDGREVWVNNSVSLLRNEDCRPACAVAVVIDVTAQKQAQHEREQMLRQEQRLREQAEEASRLRDEFLTSLSHELRTPLNLILGNLQLLRDHGSGAAEPQLPLETAIHQAEKLRQIVADLLDTAELITGRMRLRTEPLDFIPIIEAVIETLQPAAEARRISLSLSCDHKAGVLVGDPLRLRQIVWNLLSNAIRFTLPGGRVEAHLAYDEAGVELTVSDTGVGISPDFLPFVFDRFRQADGSITRRFGGLGLGLAVVRHLVELHGGSVSAWSAGEGQGATFIVRLPVIATRKELSPDGEQRPELQDQSRTLTLFDPTLLVGVSVLVVEPDTLARELIEYTLSRCGATLRTAATIDEALTLFAAWSPDLIIADAEMPDGEKLMRRARAQQTDSGHSLPAVGIISSNTFSARVRALAAGFMLHLARPVLPDELITVAASLVGRLSSSRPASQHDAKGIRGN